MSVPPDLMKALMGQVGGAPAAGPPASMAPGAPPQPTGLGAPQGGPPRAAPLSVPQPKKGLEAAGRTNMHIAINMLEEALPAFGSESDEGKDILKCLSILGKHIGQKDHQDLVPAEIAQLVARSPQVGGGTALQKQLMQQMKAPQQPPQAAAMGQ